MNSNRSPEVRHFVKPMLCGALGCAVASVLAFLKQCSSLQQYLIAGVIETAAVYAKMAHNAIRLGYACKAQINYKPMACQKVEPSLSYRQLIIKIQ